MREERRMHDEDTLDVTDSPELLRLAEEVNSTGLHFDEHALLAA